MLFQLIELTNTPFYSSDGVVPLCIMPCPQVMGVYGDGASVGSDLNALDRSPDSKYVLTSDDRSRVRLLNYPCVVDEAPAKTYRGHSSHVTNVRWSPDGERAVSVGGKDRAVFQWRLVDDAPRRARERAARARGAAEAPWAPLDSQGVAWGNPEVDARRRPENTGSRPTSAASQKSSHIDYGRFY